MQRGVQVHWLDNLTPDTNTHSLLKQLKPQIVRTPLDYNGVVNTGGAPNWGWYDNLFCLVRSWGGKVLLITPECESGYRTSNTVMDGNLFALSQGACGRYPDAMFELGNEPNAQVGQNQPITAALHVQYCRGIAAAIRQSGNPIIVSGGLSGLDLNYLQAEYNAGLFSCVSIAGIHPYGQTDFAAASNSIQAHLGNIPFWFTEFGTNTGDDSVQLATMQAYFHNSNVPVAVWYSLYGDQGFSMVRSVYPMFYS